MDSVKAIKWIKAIAVLSLLLALLGLAFYILVQAEIIDDQFTVVDHIVAWIEPIAGLIIFVGLWKLKSWGWKFTIFYTLTSWIYMVYDFIADYERFMSIVISPIFIIEALILKFLLSSDVRDCFKVGLSPFRHFNWAPVAFILLATFLFVNDFFDGYIALFTIIAMLLCFRVSKKHKKEMNLGYNK